MPIDQVASLTRERRDARRVIESLPIQDDTVQDLIAKDREDAGENPLFRSIFNGLAWTFYAVALGALGRMIWALFKS